MVDSVGMLKRKFMPMFVKNDSSYMCRQAKVEERAASKYPNIPF